jgi:hypothetical protein
MQFPRDLDEQRRVMYEAQLETNELLKQLIQLQTKPMVIDPIKPPVNRAPQNTQIKKTNTRGKRT